MKFKSKFSGKYHHRNVTWIRQLDWAHCDFCSVICGWDLNLLRAPQQSSFNVILSANFFFSFFLRVFHFGWPNQPSLGIMTNLHWKRFQCKLSITPDAFTFQLSESWFSQLKYSTLLKKPSTLCPLFLYHSFFCFYLLIRSSVRSKVRQQDAWTLLNVIFRCYRLVSIDGLLKMSKPWHSLNGWY